MRNKRLICIFFFFIVFSSCKAQRIPLIGGVYVSEHIIRDKTLSYNSIFPILAFRVDDKRSQILLIKYRFGLEQSMDIDFYFQDSCACFVSKVLVLFTPDGSQRRQVYLKFKNPEIAELFFNEDGMKQTYIYKLTYIDEVDLDTHRDVYYAEDIYDLFE